MLYQMFETMIVLFIHNFIDARICKTLQRYNGVKSLDKIESMVRMKKEVQMKRTQEHILVVVNENEKKS